MRHLHTKRPRDQRPPQMIDGPIAQLIKDLAFQLRGEIEDLFLVLGAEVNGKANLSIMIADNLVKDSAANGKMLYQVLDFEN